MSAAAAGSAGAGEQVAVDARALVLEAAALLRQDAQAEQEGLRGHTLQLQGIPLDVAPEETGP